jgi:hypothetical protein
VDSHRTRYLNVRRDRDGACDPMVLGRILIHKVQEAEGPIAVGGEEARRAAQAQEAVLRHVHRAAGEDGKYAGARVL